MKIKRLLKILLLFVGGTVSAQHGPISLEKIIPVEDYDNVLVIPHYSDSLVSTYVIYVKKDVRVHKHEFHTEVVTILEGKGEMLLGKKVFKVKKGDMIVIPKGTAHGVIVKGKRPMKVLSVQTPKFSGEDRVFID